MRRSIIAASAALALGGSLAIAASASAAQIPWGTAGVANSTSVNGLLTTADNGLIQAQNVIVGANGLAGTPFNFGSPVDTNFTTPFTSASSLTAATVAEIGTDIAASANASQLEMSVCVFDVYPTATSDTSVPDAFSACNNTSDPFLAAADAAFGPAATSGTIQNGIASAAANWGELDSLVTQLYDASDAANFPGGLYSIDGDLSISSKGTVTSKGQPTAYSITAAVSGGATTGYVLPSAFTMTFPNAFTVNTALAGAELPASDENSPPLAQSIGTVTLKSPVADAFGGASDVLTGNVFAINANNNIAQPDLELSFGTGIYLLGTFPKTLSFPLTVTFGEASVFGSPDPIPVSSLALAFPAKTSPVKATNCSNLGAVTGTGTDEVAGLAAEFGDTTDGYSASGNTPVAITSSNTVVTDLCPATVSKATITGIKKGAPKLDLGLKGNGGTPFTSESLTLPKGLSVKGLKSKDLKVSGAKLKSVSGRGTKVTVNFKSKTKAATVDFVKGVYATSKLKKAVTRHKTKSLTIKYTVKYAPATAAAANSSVLSVTVKHLS
jgi:hypothetical protein